MIAVVPVRGGVLPAGGLECVAECGGRALLVGDGVGAAVDGLIGVASEAVPTWEAGPFAPGAWAGALAPLLAAESVVVLPGSPDGRDLAPRLAHALDRVLFAGAIHVDPERVELSRRGGLVIEEVAAPAAGFVATLQPGVHGVESGEATTLTTVALDPVPSAGPGHDVEVLDVLPPDLATMDLAEAPRIVGGGAGLDSAERFAQLAEVARMLDASMGATRVVTDRGWVAHERQIGTTGVVVDPRLYLAFGISGAVQHTSGLGQPEHIVSVNTDPHAPMMQLADLAIVSDANAVLEALAARLGVDDA